MVLTKMTWVAAFGAAVLFAACGDDDSPSDAGKDAEHDDHGDHDHEDGGDDDDEDAGGPFRFSFFVTSDTSMTGDLGGLSGADARCNRLAAAAGARNPKFAAYLSADKKSEDDDTPVNARDRIGKGPWYNVKGTLIARDLEALHALERGDAEKFLDEKGNKISGQWEGSPTPIQHDILTGTNADGTVAMGKNCNSWTSSDASLRAQVGHSDGLGPSRNPDPPYASWNSSHESEGCNDTAPRGGAGKFYCFSTE